MSAHYLLWIDWLTGQNLVVHWMLNAGLVQISRVERLIDNAAIGACAK